jgi:hypothetical protein
MLFHISKRFVMDLTHAWGTVSQTFCCHHLGHPNLSFSLSWIDTIRSELLAASLDKLKTNLPVDNPSLQTRLWRLAYCITIRIYLTVCRSVIDSFHWLHCGYVTTVSVVEEVSLHTSIHRIMAKKAFQLKWNKLPWQGNYFFCCEGNVPPN